MRASPPASPVELLGRALAVREDVLDRRAVAGLQAAQRAQPLLDLREPARVGLDPRRVALEQERRLVELEPRALERALGLGQVGVELDDTAQCGPRRGRAARAGPSSPSTRSSAAAAACASRSAWPSRRSSRSSSSSSPGFGRGAVDLLELEAELVLAARERLAVAPPRGDRERELAPARVERRDLAGRGRELGEGVEQLGLRVGAQAAAGARPGS